MEEAPLPILKTPQFQLEKKIKIEGKGFTLNFIDTNEEMNLIAKEDNSLMSDSFSNTFTLNQLQKNNNYFKMFDDINDVITNLGKLIEENKFKVIKKDKSIEITFTPDILLKGEIKFNLLLKEKSPNDKINYLMELSTSILSRLDNLEKENSELKSKVKELTEKLDKLNKLKNASYFFKDSVILTTEQYKEKMLSFINEKIEDTELLYRGTRDGDSSNIFHEKCDNKGPTIVLCKETSGQIFGGFTKAEWDNKDRHPKADKDAFIFSITNNKKFNSKNHENSIVCHPDFGPVFGFGGDLTIWNHFLSTESNNMWSEQKTYFDKNYDTTKNKKNFRLSELEVYLIKF